MGSLNAFASETMPSAPAMSTEIDCELEEVPITTRQGTASSPTATKSDRGIA